MGLRVLGGMQAPKVILRSPWNVSSTKFRQTDPPLLVDKRDHNHQKSLTQKSEEDQDPNRNSLRCETVSGNSGTDTNVPARTVSISENKDAPNEPSQKNEATQTRGTSKSKKGIANPASITPTVILNGLAMARGETVAYQVIEKTALPVKPIYDFKNVYPPSYFNYNRDVCDLRPPPVGIVRRWIYPYIFRVLVTVGDRSFSGEGKSRQAARHNAAKAALEVLQAMPIPKHSEKQKLPVGSNEQGNNPKNNSSKSKVSVLYEMVSASRLKIDFRVVSETGPPHLKVFKTRVTIYTNPSEAILTAEGSGNNKNYAKAKAAEAALDAIKINPLPENKSGGKKKQSHAKVFSNLSSNTALHPSSRLSQIMQAQKKVAPVYKIISSDVFNPHNSSYDIQCTVDGQTATGQGRSKKDAKRDASEKMLILLGFHSQSQQDNKASQSVPSRPAVKSSLKAISMGIGLDILPPLKEV